ncbi:GntR family transcriptional regulator [Paenibacillus sp. FSL H7-0326]|uniref:MocR-like pyridoxine biosynthesis transcription factor PdxR n=1 Tax=Paenibacillus sp. FSL H7-0326 TaxID=1921144 RepID=UPI00096FAD43|nr:PLP-dependent aminotransferase family protein [Paenibacillus sp. FSL H7-0326]OMC71430.1 GntR family transcriptional regulator [Paenibacillus sp. FSL H7-0326]
MLPITPALDAESKEPLFIQLYNFLKSEIQSNHIAPNSKLPSQRKLANNLNVSRNTVDAAYQQLISEGYIRSEARRGIFVVEIKNDLLLSGFPKIDSNRSNILMNQNQEEEKTPEQEIYDFKYGDIDLVHFPFKVWRQINMKALNVEQASLLLYGDPQGEIELRKHISRYLFQSRGVECSEEQIVIGAGTQYLIGLLCNMIGRNFVYGIEEPGYDRARLILKDYGKRVAPIPLDNQGLNVSELIRSDVKAVYVTPSHQYPTGTIMPVSRRLDLINWARETDGYIIEDDYDSEFRYESKPIPSLQSLDCYGNVIYLGTFAKSLIPSLRITYLVLPSKLLSIYKEKFWGYKQTVSRIHQHTLNLFIESGDWLKHLNRVRNIYRKRHHELLEAIQMNMKDRVRIIGSGSGLHLLLEVNNGMSENQLIASAKEMGVVIYPVSPFYEIPPSQEFPKVLLGFAGLDENRIREGIKILNKAWF